MRRNTTKLTDVAREAGVSVATVSRCLHMPDKVNASTRERVMRIIARTGYAPDLAARALKTGRSRIMGAVVPTLENSIFARGLQAFQDELSANDTTLLLASSNYDPDSEFRQVRALAAQGIGGLMLIGEARSADVYDLLERYAIPYVVAWILGAPGHSSVGFDNRAAAEMMTRAVIDAGHRRIAMVAGISRGNDRAAGRIEGVRKACAEAGLAEPTVREAAYSFDAAGDALDEILVDGDTPDAVICGNDVQGVGVVRRAQRRGLSVPGDFVVTGFDDIDLASVVSPALTTVHVPHRRMGTLCARVLLEGGTRRDVIETQIVWRSSFPKP